MKQEKTFLVLELTVLFILLPFILVLEISPFIKAAAILTGLVYVLYLAAKSKKITRKSLITFSTLPYWKPVLFRFALLIICTTLFMYFVELENLFAVVRKIPLMWVIITLFYSIFSVYPQEFLYRSFFFTRYEQLFKKKYVLIAINAIVFSLGHIMFKNLLVLILTLLGGFVFAVTYHKTKSLLFTTIEHSIYGSWLFTVGMGEMLAFPMPE